MDHQDHVNLLKDGVPAPGGVWADFGAGQGAFTLALADLLGPQGEIWAVDKDGGALRAWERQMDLRFPDRPPGMTHSLTADFTRPLDLPALDGAIMANALHFLKGKLSTVELIRSYLRPGGRFLLVEYNVDRGNMWVPYPLSYPTWEVLARQAGFRQVRLLATRPSRFLGEIYSAQAE